MLKTITAIFMFAGLYALSSCATTDKSRPKQSLLHIEKQNNSSLLLNKAVAESVLLEQYEEWKGTKYKYGGLSKQGIDCSGFIYITFLEKFGIKLPRRSIVQGKVGYDIPTQLLQPGDLVFFKTGLNSRHVGIYIGNGVFIHASSKQGVTKSTLKDPYWHPRFWKARRISL